MNAIIRHSRPAGVLLDQIDLPANARPTNATDVVALVSSIRAIGLQVPVTVIERGGRYLLIAGRHRLEALAQLARSASLPVSRTSTTSRRGSGPSPRTCTAPN